MSGARIRELGVNDLDELSNFIPGLNVQEQSANDPGIVIRGITSDSGSAQQGPRVADVGVEEENVFHTVLAGLDPVPRQRLQAPQVEPDVREAREPSHEGRDGVGIIEPDNDARDVAQLRGKGSDLLRLLPHTALAQSWS